jgi:hypothetical protein
VISILLTLTGEREWARVPRKSQLKILSFFEAKLPLLPLERHFFEISIKPT